MSQHSVMLIEDVFKVSGVPTVTFVEPEEYARLFVALRTKGRGVVIEGPSGIGKSTCVANALQKLGLRSSVMLLSGRKAKDIESIKTIIAKDSFGTLIIDDFHKLPVDLKSIVAELLKTFADEEVEHSKIVIVGINKTGASLIELTKDLRNRIEVIKFESNPSKKMQELLEKGEKALNIAIPIKDSIVQESCGSFHLTQLLAQRACIKSGITESQTSVKNTNVSIDAVREELLDELAPSFEPLTMLFSVGQRQKPGTRAPYLHVLMWLSQTNDMSLNINTALLLKPLHKKSVSQILTKDHLMTHYSKEDKLHDVLFYDNETTELTVEDPKFFFYIKHVSWRRIAEKIGFTLHEDECEDYAIDYALSFAGADRDLAKMISDKLQEENIDVFYDYDNQHDILAKNVEDYLSNIYQKKARYIIALLSDTYPQRVWCKFEADAFKHRFGENAVIPIRFVGCNPSPFDATAVIGGLTYDSSKDMETQVSQFVEVLEKKIIEARAAFQSV